MYRIHVASWLLILLSFIIPDRELSSQPVSGPHIDRPLRAIINQNISLITPDDHFAITGFEIKDTVSVIIYADENTLKSLTVPISSQHKNFGTARLSIQELKNLLTDDGIERITLGGTYQFLLDKSRTELRTDQLQSGLLGHKNLIGEGVLVGLIDTGIDFYHHDFRYGNDLQNSRISRIWNMGTSPFGDEAPPHSFGYGVEFTREDIEHDFFEPNPILKRVRSVDFNGHGTYMAGVVGGNGHRSDGIYKGNAPGVEYVIVQLPPSNIGEATIIDAINYIFSIADKYNKPAVINLSIGTHYGAHDGTSALELVIDEYAKEPGRAIVTAAGNSGEIPIHSGGTIATNDEANINIYVGETESSNISDIVVWSQLWYESDGDVTATITTPQGEEISVVSGEEKIVTTADGIIDIETMGDYRNKKGARVFDIVFHTDRETESFSFGDWELLISSVDANITYNMWLVSSNAPVINIQPNTGRNYTVMTPATAKSAISVGSYTIRNSWESYIGTITSNAELDELSSFSSGGPTRDGRVKPEITAPGEIIISTLSDNARYRFFTRFEHDWYDAKEGTSISAAQVTGIIALLMEHNPGLRGIDIRDILMNSARQDNYTQNIPNNFWGSGKADAYAAVGYAGGFMEIPYSTKLSYNYPNPFNNSTIIQFTLERDSHVNLSVYDILGRKIETLVDEVLGPNIHAVRFDAVGLSSGVYFYRIDTDAYTDVKRMVLIR